MIQLFEVIKNFFTWAYDFFHSAFESIYRVSMLVIKLIKDIPLFIKLTTEFSADLDVYLSWLPASVVSVIMLCIGLSIAYKFFGRT